MQQKLRSLPPAVAERLLPELQRAVALLRDRRFEDVDASIRQVVAVLARVQLAMAKAPQPKMPQPKAPAAAAVPPSAAPKAAVERGDDVAQRMGAAMDRLRRQAEGLPEGAAAAARAALGRADAALAQGEAEAALAAMKQARDLMRAALAARQKWGKVLALMQGPVEQAAAGGGLANPAALRRRWAAVVALADGGRWADALAAVPGIAALVRHAVLAARTASA
jgi:hypothetical protein